MFEDKKGQELLKFHAEKNMGTTVENDQATTVWHDQTLDVKNNRTVIIDGIEKYTVKKEQINHVIRNQTNNYDAHTFTITKGNQTLGTIGEMTNIVNGSIKEHSNASINVSAVAGYSLTAQTLTGSSVGGANFGAAINTQAVILVPPARVSQTAQR